MFTVVYDYLFEPTTRVLRSLFTMCVYACRCVCLHDEMIIPDWNELKLCTVVVVDSLPKPIDLGFKMSRVRIRVRVVACGSKLCRNTAGVTEYNSLWKNSPHLYNVY